MDFDLTKDWIQSRLEGVCELSGMPFDFLAAPRDIFTPSIDRVNSELGYTQDNCRVIVWALNAAFGTWGEAAFRDLSLQWHKRSNATNPSYLFMSA